MISLTNAIKYIEINLRQYTRDYETPIKKMERDINTWGDSLMPWIVEIHTVKMFI